jgi:serine/threonine protein kinase
MYMSPERIHDKEHTFNSDIWSLGITLIELRLGKCPFIAKSYFDIMEAINNIKEFNYDENDFSYDFIQFLKSCLEVDSENRPKAIDLLKSNWIKKFMLPDDKIKTKIIEFLNIN